MACFYPSHYDNFGSRKRIEKFRFKESINLHYLVEKNIIDMVLRNILINECNMTIVGYCKNESKYWCKKYVGKTCDLHFEIKLSYIDLKSVIFLVTPLMGSDNNIEQFIYKINISMLLYGSSALTKFMLDK